jgi:hypothetical protein
MGKDNLSDSALVRLAQWKNQRDVHTTFEVPFFLKDELGEIRKSGDNLDFVKANHSPHPTLLVGVFDASTASWFEKKFKDQIILQNPIEFCKAPPSVLFDW